MICDSTASSHRHISLVMNIIVIATFVLLSQYDHLLNQVLIFSSDRRLVGFEMPEEQQRERLCRVATTIPKIFDRLTDGTYLLHLYSCDILFPSSLLTVNFPSLYVVFDTSNVSLHVVITVPLLDCQSAFREDPTTSRLNECLPL